MTIDFEELRQRALKETKKDIKDSVEKDLMIVHVINNIEELEKSINVLAGRLREWFQVENPELERKIEDNEEFANYVFNYSKELSDMGNTFDTEDLNAVKGLAAGISGLVHTKKFLTTYLEKTMNDVCPNVLTLAGVTIGAKLIREARSLKRLASLQSGTLQLLGAEKALFRHIKTGARSPKYGYIINHQVVSKAKKEDKGKAARALADKLSIAARLDYFKGEMQGEALLSDLIKKFN